jgi:hypothetical protein
MDLMLVENTVRRFFRFALKVENLEHFIGPPEPKRTAAEDQMIRRKKLPRCKGCYTISKKSIFVRKDNQNLNLKFYLLSQFYPIKQKARDSMGEHIFKRGDGRAVGFQR